VASAFISAAAPLNTVASFRNAEIDLGIADGKLVGRITPKSAGCLMAPVHLAVVVDPEVKPDDEETEVRLYLEQNVADMSPLDHEY
jgi:hypothetical protein